ncbi:MAG: trypsin-like peptidase domain-containing protein [Anaerolineae bacterium]|nr:trypsin-like peptidase domain-containing protein [Anaerolineae bacterium]
MSKIRNNQRGLLAAMTLALLASALGCGLVSLPAADIESEPVPTAAPAATLPPLLNEAEAVRTLESQIIAVYEMASPSVVNVTNRGYVYSWFGRAIPQEGSGSGFVVDSQGHIVTNYHVVEGAEELLVTLASGQVFEAQLVGSDPANDLAILHVDAGDELPPPLPLADSDQLRVGQFVVAIGNPFGLEQTLTTGVVSALGRVIESPEDDRFIGEVIQTDAAINPGNSGGPLLDLSGHVVGVNSQIVSTSGSSAGVGFAISSNTLQRVVPELIDHGSYPHPWLGAQFLDLTPSAVRILQDAGMDIPVDSGLLVLETVRNGPADKAGVRDSSRTVRVGNYQVPIGGDIVVAIDGELVASFQDLTVYLENETAVGDTVELTIVRDGEITTVTVTLEATPQT